MKLYIYIKEIKYRFLILFLTLLFNIIVFITYKAQIAYLLGNNKENILPYFIATNMAEIFIVYVKFSFFFSCYFIYPIFIKQAMLFLTPGLYNYEYKMLRTIGIISISLYCLCTIIVYKILLPYSWIFFSGFELKSNLINIYIETKFKDFVEFFIKNIISLNIFFHLFIIFIFITKNTKNYYCIHYRKLFYFFYVLCATIFSPPDIYSQLFISMFLIIIYEVLLLKTFILYYYKRANNGTRTHNLQSHNLTL